MTNRKGPSDIVFLIWRSRELEAGMHVLAGLAVRTKPGQVVAAEHSANMSMPALRSMPAETTVIPRKKVIGILVAAGISYKSINTIYLLI